MALSTARMSELPFLNSTPLCSRPSLSLLGSRFRFFFSVSASSTPVRIAKRSGDPDARRTPHTHKYNDDQRYKNSNPRKPPSAPWLQKWSPSEPQSSNPTTERTSSSTATQHLDHPEAGAGSIERIVHRLRNLGLDKEEGEMNGRDPDDFPINGEETLGQLLERSWNRPGDPDPDEEVLPWERERDSGFGGEREGEGMGLKKRRVRAPSLAELTIEDTELKRLRKLGIMLRERMTVPKAGVTQAIAEKMHDVWKKSELVRLKFHEDLAHDMRMAHELVERRTGGLVIWRSGSVMIVYRGSNYKRPSIQSSNVENIPTNVPCEGDTLFVPDVSGSVKLDVEKDTHQNKPSQMTLESAKSMTEEETEFNQLLDGLGPRFVDWWGTGILPVDADLLPQTIPGYKTPFRLLPTGMRSNLTNSEMTSLRKLARALPCHFALGRNKHHQGLAAAILKLWETSLVAKIAVKRGVQNTNNKLMSEELKKLTGGVLLLRNKYYIVIYRGKDFLPTTVATALAERQELTKDIQDVEEKARSSIVRASHINTVEGHALAGTLAEFQEAQARWGRNISAEERAAMKEVASRSEKLKLFRKIEHKLFIAQSKKIKAERLLSKIESSMVPAGPSEDQETITDEERSVFRRIGLRMKSYLPLGVRGVFDGVIENMHLHWKHRELVKLISKQKNLSFVEETARLLEYESGGILVAVERVPKGFAVIYYRGKNYQRPINLRPRNLLTKAKALKRAVAMQRHEALSEHISEVERTIEQMKLDLVGSENLESVSSDQQQNKSYHASYFSENEDEETSQDDYDHDSDEDDGNDSDFDDGSSEFSDESF